MTTPPEVDAVDTPPPAHQPATALEAAQEGAQKTDVYVRPTAGGRTASGLDRRALLAAVAVFALGLVAVRWASLLAALPSEPGPLRAGLVADSLVDPDTGVLSPGAEPPTDDLSGALAEAMRLAEAALVDEDLTTARDLYFLAVQVAPDDGEAGQRLRQVETALSIDQYAGPWQAAISELEDLLRLVPGSAGVLDSYVSALVGGGRDAALRDDTQRAASLCGEAIRRLPERADAQSCLQQPSGSPSVGVLNAGATLSPVARPVASPTQLGPATTVSTPPPAISPIARWTATPLTASGPALQVFAAVSCEGRGFSGNSVANMTGAVLADGLSTRDYRLTITAQDHGGNTAPITDLLYRAPALAVQWSSALRGPQTIVVSVEKPGYEPVLTELAMVCR